MKMFCKILSVLFFCILCFLHSPNQLYAQNSEEKASPGKVLNVLTLTKAVMCEEIQNHSPKNISVIFSTDLEKVCCYTSFDPVKEKGNIYHVWYYRDEFITKIKLAINPPRWSTFSSIQLRKMDKGPWRVDIEDEHRKIYGVLRFSITD